MLKAEAVKQHVNDLCSQVLSHNAGPMYWLRKWTRSFNFQWERDHQQPETPFPYRPFADRKIDLRSLPFPHDFTAADPPDYIDILMGFLMFTKDIAKHDELWIPKSREMMTSWTVVGYITWHCPVSGHVAPRRNSKRDGESWLRTASCPDSQQLETYATPLVTPPPQMTSRS